MRAKHSIQDLLNQFDIPNQDVWWQQVEKEIGDKTKAFEIEPGLEILPLEEAAQPREPIIWKPNQDWKIVESTDINLWEQIDEQMHFDLDEIILQMHNETDINRYPDQFTSCSFSGRMPPHLVPYAISSNKFGNSFIQMVPPDASTHHLLDASSPPFHWRYAHADKAVMGTERLTTLLKQLYRHLTENPDQAEQWRLFIEISDAFFTQIAELRALKILILNLWQAFKLNPMTHPQIYAIIRPDNQKDLYTNLIRSTSQALSAVVGGIDALCFESDSAIGAETDWAKEYGRLSRNIHYILKHEAHLNHRIDPISGSFRIEAITDALASKTWTNLGGQDPEKSVK